ALGSCKDDVGITVTERLAATLSGAKVVPTPITTTATGTAQFTYVGDIKTLVFEVDVVGIDSVTLAHVHAPAPVDSSAGVALNLYRTGKSKNGGDAQPWYFNNRLPAAMSVKALDANNCAVTGVVINWVVASGGGGVTPAQSTTGTNGVASATDSIGSSTPQSVTATPAITTLPTLTFSATAAAPPTSGAVTLQNIA